MRVLVFTSLYPNSVWPAHGVFVKERMTRFANLPGCDVKVVAPVPYFPRIGIGWRRAYARIPVREAIEGRDVHHPRYVMLPKVGMATYGALMFLGALRAARALQRRWRFDLIDAHYVYPDGFAGVLLARTLGLPVVVSARGSDINLFPSFPTVRPLVRYTLAGADGVIAVCQALKDAMASLGCPIGKIHVVPNGVDPEKFRPMGRSEARERLGLPSHRRLVLSVGGLVSRKGFDVLVKAIEVLSRENGRRDTSLIIVGEGPERRALESLVADTNLGAHVRLVGAVPHEELHWWYSAADVFCLASSREGWPNVLLEALACGTPVVATDVWGIPEVIRTEEVGLLTEREPRAIARTLEWALDREWHRDALRRYAQKRSWGRVAHEVRQVFESVLGSGGVPVADLSEGQAREAT